MIMPYKKRTKKKTARKKQAPRRKTSTKSTKHKSSWLTRVCVLLILGLLLLCGIYYFGSFDTRSSIERGFLSTLNSLRTHGSTPAPVARLLDTAHDAFPTSVGLVVEGGELGRDATSPFLAGIPHSRQPIRPLLQASYTNLFNEKSQQAACIALRLDDSPREKASTTDPLQVDSRMPRLTAQAMTLGQWAPHSIAPAKALSGQHGNRGARDAQLATNHAPMSAAFATGSWQKAMHELTIRYPERFGEVWIYLGPVYHPEGAKLASDIAIPDAFYAIVLDLTDEGGLRALALLIPADAESNNLNNYITSIAEIEKLTGLQFLPELDFSIRDTLGNFVSPNVW